MGLRSTALLSKLGFPMGDTPEKPTVMVAGSSGVADDLSSSSLVAHLREESVDGERRKFSRMEEDILNLLSDGHSQEVVASTLGITPSAISQHIAKDEFREELADRKLKKLAKYTKLDNGYDRIEAVLLEKLEASLMLLSRPMEIAAVLTKINQSKRRLADQSNVQNTTHQTVININLPAQIIHRFTKTSDGHVVGVDEKSLVTINSSSLPQMAMEAIKEIPILPPPILSLGDKNATPPQNSA
jgi:DNA-binding CsgD family transcriptional regulator